MATYKTITGPAEASFTEKRSRFLAFAFPVSTPEEARLIVKEFAKKFYDARHVCFAYMLGADRQQFLANDNGEPSGTAGRPILGQIHSLELTDVIVLVVRYFGGIKLGTPGLIAAYKESARLVLEAADIVERRQMHRFTVRFPYMAINDIMKAVKHSDITVVDRQFDNTCSITVEVPADMAQALRDRMLSVSGATE
ncbi:MAG: IMPACT family protein [Muribaculaceae bacterium]|nr:IMPACT family protein [Muribaculaceae bacterium]